MSVFDDIKQLTGTRYHRAEHNGDILDDYYMRAARERGIRLPTGNDNKDPEYINYLGAHVETPTAGLSEHVVYLDLSSLYPNTILQQNVSPETLIGTREDVADSQYSEDDCVWGYVDTRDVKWLNDGETYSDFTDETYKMVYDPTASSNKVKWTTDDPRYEKCYFIDPSIQQGLVPSLVEDLIALKDKYTGSMYGAVKRIVNSIYGTISEATENRCSRLYDWRMAESITLTGRKVIQYTRDKAIELLRERGYTDAYAAVGDTDGMGIALPSADSWEDCMDAVIDVVQSLNDEHYAQFMHDEFGLEQHHMEVETESYARRLFVPAENPSQCVSEPNVEHVGSKKRYAQYVELEDSSMEKADVVINGVPFERPNEIELTGIEAVRSDTADCTTEVQSWVLEQLVTRGTDARDDITAVLSAMDACARNGTLPPSYLATRGGIGQDLSEYGSANRRAAPIYRGAKWANDQLDTEICEGDKPQKYAVSGVGPHRPIYRSETAESGDVVDYVSLPQSMDVPDELTIDYATMTDKALKQPLRPIVQTMGWDYDEMVAGTQKTSLAAFM